MKTALITFLQMAVLVAYDWSSLIQKEFTSKLWKKNTFNSLPFLKKLRILFEIC